MFCPHCGGADQDATFCSACGARIKDEPQMAGGTGEISLMASNLEAAAPLQQAGQVQSPSPYDAPPVVHQAVPVTRAPSGFSTASIVLGAVSFLFFPFIIGVLGIIFGAIAMSKKQPRAAVGLTLSIIGTILGTIFGLITGLLFL